MCRDSKLARAGDGGRAGRLVPRRLRKASVHLRCAPSYSFPSQRGGTRGTYSKDVPMLLLHPCQEAGGILPELQGMTQPRNGAGIQRGLTRSPAEATVGVTT